MTLLCACLVLPLQAGPTTTAKPEELGLSSERLMRVREAVQRHIDAKAVAGAVTMVARNGRIAHLEAHGLIDIEAKRTMPKDGIFRLASMSKPITAVAVLMLIKEGKIRLNDPVSRFIPEPPASPAGGRGGRGGPPVEVDLVLATREITIRDLLTHGASSLGRRIARHEW